MKIYDLRILYDTYGNMFFRKESFKNMKMYIKNIYTLWRER